MASLTLEHRFGLPEIEALLGRPARLQRGTRAHQYIAGRRVLVTGAGGSIGGEIVRQLAVLDPCALFMLDSDESLLHAVQLDVFADGQLDKDRTVLADIRDAGRLRRLFQELRPDIVFHAAALKHLTMLERFPSEGIRTNTIGTLNVIEASRAAGTSTFIFVSTDKAADPTSVLGSSKSLAERLVAEAATDGMRTASVRFGNVLGSRGSFLHTLVRQIESGRPVTLTHPEVDRYFMSIPEAAGLVLETTVMADNGEVFVLDMGTPVKVRDLITRFAQLRGVAEPDIRITGLRPGEKLSEILVSDAERCLPSAHEQIWCVPAALDEPLDGPTWEALSQAAMCGDDARVVRLLNDYGYAVKPQPHKETRIALVPLPRERNRGLVTALAG